MYARKSPMASSVFVPVFVLSIFLNLPVANAQTTQSQDEETAVELAPIVKEGSVSDVLMADPVLPSFVGKTKSASGSGGIEHGLANEIPVSFTDTGAPGNLAQIRGLGKGAQETDVQTLGIPLNGAQGGGFDFSTFPQFFWSDFRYQIGPSLGAFDPAGVAGSLTLTPWTEAALTQEGGLGAGRGTAFYSDAGVTQLSIAGRRKDTAAALVGYSTGLVEGPTGSFSATHDFGPHRVRFHFLGTDLDAKSRRVKGAPYDEKFTERAIPVVETDFRLSNETLLKSTFFYDWNSIRSKSPSGRLSSVARIGQVGAENALVLGNYKFGFSARHISYDASDTDPLIRNIFSVQGARSFEFGDLLVEPSLRLTEVTSYNVLPEGSLGIRYELVPGETGLFTRASYTRRYPTLVDQYYFYPYSIENGPGFKGNPDLKPEKDITWIVGADYKSPNRVFDGTLQVMAQKRFDGQVNVPIDEFYDTTVNADTAEIYAALFTLGARPFGWLDLSNAVTATHSHVSSTDQPYPYMPDWIDVASVAFHPTGDRPEWKFIAISRASTGAGVYLDQTVPGYAYFDLRFEAWLWRKDVRGLNLELGAQNIFNREVEIVKGNPIEGRTYTFSLLAEL